MSQLEEYIKSTFLLPEENVTTLKELFKPLSLKKGDYFLKAGRPSEKLGFLTKGLIRIYATMEDKEVTQWISTPGYFVTDLSGLIFKKPSRWDMHCLTDCEMFVISKEDYQNIGTVIPQWSELEKMFIARCFVMLEERIFSHLYMSAEERYKHLFSLQPTLFNEVPLQYLASMLGMTPETMSRLRKRVE